MNKISGRVVLKESGAGIPDLQVVIYDLDPGTKAEEQIPIVAVSRLPFDGEPIPSAATIAISPDPDTDGDRLGSVLTRASDGLFEVIFEDSEFQIRAPEKRPDLLLSVWSPEEPGQEPMARLLYSSSVIQNAGRTEQCLIRLSTEELQKAGIVPHSGIPQDLEPGGNVVGRFNALVAHQTAIADGNIAAARKLVGEHRTRFAGFRQNFRTALMATTFTILRDSESSSGFGFGPGFWRDDAFWCDCGKLALRPQHKNRVKQPIGNEVESHADFAMERTPGRRHVG
jgi:hypothetical protein